MTADLLTDLDRLGDLLERASRPIDVQQIVDRTPVAFDVSSMDPPRDDRLVEDGMAVVVSEGRLSRASTRRWRAAAAFVAVAAIVGTVWIVSSRPADVPVAVDVPTIGAVGHMTLDAPPPGWRFELASDSIDTSGSDRVVQRIYATASSTPETGPALLLTSMSAEVGKPGVFGATDTKDPNRIFVDVQKGAGELTQSDGGGQSLTFGPLDGFNYLLTGFHVSEDELVAAANTVHVSPDGHGAVIDATALPAGVTERGTGFVSEIWFISTLAATHPIPEAHWTDGSGELWYRSFEDPAMAALGRFGFDTVTDTTVNGQPGYVATVAPAHQQGTVASVMWSDGTRTFLLASNKIDAAQLQTLAAALRPATDAQWEAMIKSRPATQSTDPTTTLLQAAGGTPSALLPTWLPDGLAVWSIESLPTSSSVTLRSVGQATGTRQAETSWSLTRSNTPFDPAVTTLEQITLNDGTIAYYEVNDTSQWLHWKTTDGYEVLMNNNRMTLSREDFEHLARSLTRPNSATLDAAKSAIVHRIHTELLPIRAGDIGSTHLEVLGSNSKTAAAICVVAAGAPEDCQTAVGDTATVIANGPNFVDFRFQHADGSIDTYGWISPKPSRIDHPPTITLERADDANGTWIHIHGKLNDVQQEVSVHMPDGSTIQMGI